MSGERILTKFEPKIRSKINEYKQLVFGQSITNVFVLLNPILFCLLLVKKFDLDWVRVEKNETAPFNCKCLTLSRCFLLEFYDYNVHSAGYE